MENEYQSGDFTLAWGRGSSWSGMDHHLWCDLVRRFVTNYCDAISFDCVATADQITDLSVFEEHQPAYVKLAEYCPNSIPMTADPETFTLQVAKFSFDTWIASLLLEEDFGYWHVSNLGSHADEILFWRGERLFVHVIPWEGIVYFNGITLEQLKELKSVSEDIGPNLFSR